MSTGVETRVVEKKGLKAVDVAVIAVLLAVGAVLRMFTPPFFGITPNLIIGMYCLAVLLLRPKFGPIIGIGLVAAAVCQLTTKSLIPYLNFISEPVGAIAVGLLAMIKLEAGFLKVVRPFLITFLGTLVSGFTYISIFKGLTLFITVAKNPAYAYLTLVVVVTAVANAILATVLYFPLKAALRRD
ncbi:MAG TPA: tryptophan transporter [Bacillota bacterium]|nr:tryptophan transporter [Bacillota bacterium]